MFPRQFFWNGKDLLRQEQKFAQILKSTLFQSRFPSLNNIKVAIETFLQKILERHFTKGECFNYFLVTAAKFTGDGDPTTTY